MNGHYTVGLRDVVTEFKDLVVVLVYYRTVAGSTAMQGTRRTTWVGTEEQRLATPLIGQPGRMRVGRQQPVPLKASSLSSRTL